MSIYQLRSLPALALVLTTICQTRLPGQRHLILKAPVPSGTSAASAPVLTGMPGILVLVSWTNPSMTQFTFSSGTTDELGRFPIPSGMQPFVVEYLLEGASVRVKATQMHSTSEWDSESTAGGSLGFPAGAPMTGDIPLDISTFQGSLLPTLEGFSAYYHVAWGLVRLAQHFNGPLPTNFLPLPIQFQPAAPGSPKDAAIVWNPTQPYLSITVPGIHGPGLLSTSGNDRPRSATVMAHECAHLLLGNPSGLSAAQDYVHEGVADFMAAVACGTSIIGEGLSPHMETDLNGNQIQILPRDLDSNATFLLESNALNRYIRCQPLGAALYHARNSANAPFFAANLRATVPMQASQVPFGMTADMALLHRLLQIDDNDGNLGNGTPRAGDLFQSFVGRHHYPWPVLPYAGPVGSGFGSPTPGVTPTLTGNAVGSITMHAFGMPPMRLGFFVAAGVPNSASIALPGCDLFIDLAHLMSSWILVTDGAGVAIHTVPLPPGLSGAVAVQAFVDGGTGCFGLAGSNGLQVQF